MTRLTAARRKAFEGLCRHAPCTGQELVRAIGYLGAWKRLNELERQQVVVREGLSVQSQGKSAIWHVDPEAELIEYQKPEGSKTLTLHQRIQVLEIPFSNSSANCNGQPKSSKELVLMPGGSKYQSAYGWSTNPRYLRSSQGQSPQLHQCPAPS